MRVFCSIAVIILCACSGTRKMNPASNMDTHNALQSGFDMEGHRGCRGLEPENTIPAMMKALDLGVTTLEMDIVFTRDKKAILSHEPFFNHEISTKPDGKYVTEAEERSLNIYRMSYEETRRYDVGLKPHPRFPRQEKMAVTKPLLSELLDSIQAYMITGGRRHYPYLNIETKTMPATDNLYHPGPEEFVELLVAVLREKKVEAYVIIQSFDFRTLRYIHKKYPAIRTAMLIDGKDTASFDDQLTKLGFTPLVYSPHYSLVNEALVKKCHDRDIKLLPWTVNDRAMIKKLKEMGVDGIITDFPDLFSGP